ncbi:MAG: hypothetical protein Q4F99_02165 [bacterium]|nr:hypothetical protein [bacterium]
MDLIKTSLNREYAIRFFGVAALFVAFAGWFFYDGKWGYPAENEAVRPICEELVKQNLTAEEWMSTEKYGISQLDHAFQQRNVEAPSFYKDAFQSAIREEKEIVKNREWSKAVLLTPVHTPDKIQEQYVSALVSLFAAFIFCMIPLYRQRKTFSFDGETLRFFVADAECAAYPVSEMVIVDRSQWEKRGILKIQMQNNAVVTLDAWHYKGVQAIEKCLPKTETPTSVE